MKNRGFTLVELMIVVAIMAIIGTIALPLYTNYVREARFGSMRVNLDSIVLLLEDFRLDNGNYGTASTQYASQAAINSQYGWDPLKDLSDYSFVVDVPADNSTYNMWVSHAASGLWYRCDSRMSNCCDGDDGSPAACP
jgi:prepilin-type N-terminal cleavage/methylation domain-containing protein